MKRIQFAQNGMKELEFIQMLQENEAVSDNNFEMTGDTIDRDNNIIESFPVNVYHFSEWLESMEQLSPTAIMKTRELYPNYEFNRFLPEWYYNLELHKNGFAYLDFDIESMAIDVCNSGPYEYIQLEEVEPYVQMRIQGIFTTLQTLGLYPKWVEAKSPVLK